MITFHRVNLNLNDSPSCVYLPWVDFYLTISPFELSVGGKQCHRNSS